MCQEPTSCGKNTILAYRFFALEQLFTEVHHNLFFSRNLIQPQLLPGFADALESSDRQLKDLRITGNINDIKDERCRDVFRKRIAKFLGEDSMLHPLRREVFRMADHVSEM